MNKEKLNEEERIIFEAIIAAREVQEYLWKESSLLNFSLSLEKEKWIEIFQKRVNKISQIDFNNPSCVVELRKRLLQQAALSILALKIIDTESKV
jgi:hypothetical protein